MNPFVHTALKLRSPAENLLLLVSRVSTDDVVCFFGAVGMCVTVDLILSVGVGFCGLSSTCCFGLSCGAGCAMTRCAMF